MKNLRVYIPEMLLVLASAGVGAFGGTWPSVAALALAVLVYLKQQAEETLRGEVLERLETLEDKNPRVEELSLQVADLHKRTVELQDRLSGVSATMAFGKPGPKR